MGTPAKIGTGVVGVVAVWLALATTVFGGTFGPPGPRPAIVGTDSGSGSGSGTGSGTGSQDVTAERLVDWPGGGTRAGPGPLPADRSGRAGPRRSGGAVPGYAGDVAAGAS